MQAAPAPVGRPDAGATVTMKTTASKSDVGHMALLRRDIAKEAGCDG